MSEDRTYKITGIDAERERKWDSKFGPMVSEYAQLEGVDGTVEVTRKEVSPVLEVGKELFGHIEDGQYGKKFKKASSQQGGGGFRGAGPAADPKREARIVRQHSQHMALLYAQMRGVQPTLDELKQVIDWFDKDAFGAGGA